MPESGGDSGGGDPSVINRLSEAVKRDFSPQATSPDVKKNSSADGATQSGSTGFNESPNTTHSSPNPSDAASAGLKPEANHGNGTATPKKEIPDAGKRVPARSGGDVGDSATAENLETERLDPLALLERGLPADEKEEEGTSTKSSHGAEAATAGSSEVEPEKQPGAKGLRSQLERTISEKRQLEQRLKSLEGVENPKVKELATAYELEKKRADELEQKVAHYDYSESPEFKERYVKPFEERFRDAQDTLSKLTKADGGKLTMDELESIMVSGEVDAYQLITEMFDGAKQMYASNLVKDVYSLDRARTLALQQSRHTALQRRKDSQAQQVAQTEALRNRFQEEIETRRTKNSEWYAPREKDTKWNRALQDGETLADAAFIPPANIKPEQAVAIMAEVRHRAAAFVPLQQGFLALEGKVAALEKELARYKGSTPGRGEVGDTATHAPQSKFRTMDDAKNDLRALIDA